MVTGGIYLIENTCNGKRYVGSSVNIGARWTDHRKLLNRGIHHSQHLQHAWTCYGSGAFTFHVREVADCLERDWLIQREQYWLDTFQAYDPASGYNVRRVADSNAGIKRPDMVGNNRGFSNRGRRPSEEARSNMSLAQRLNMGRPEIREKISRAKKGWKQSKEQCRKQSERMRGTAFHARSYTFLSPGEETIHLTNLKAFCLANGLEYSCMLDVSAGRARYHKGWKREEAATVG